MNTYFLLFIMSFSLYLPIESNNAASFDKDQERSVQKVYASWYGKGLHTLLTSYKWPSVLAGKFANTRLSSKFIPHFIKKYSLNVDDFEKNMGEYKNFNDFFARKLKKNKRTIARDRQAIASPADGSALVVQNIGKHTQFPIKGVNFNIEELLKNAKLAAEFEGGTAFIIRLAPWDYHRLHFPIEGVPGRHTVIHGLYESVHPFVYSLGIQPLTVNERHLIVHQTATVGKVALIPVGALFVGGITETYKPGNFCAKGDEMAYFSFGGSTIVVLFKKDAIQPTEEMVVNSAQGKETPVKMGQELAHVRS